MLSLLTINAALQDVRILSLPVYRPLDHIQERLDGLERAIQSLQADIVCIQELFHYDLQSELCNRLSTLYPHQTSLLASKGPGLRLGNELITLSRFPMEGERFVRFRHAALEERLFISRGFVEMHLDIPAAGRVKLVNVHLTAGGLRQHPENAAMRRIRRAQIRQLLASLDQAEPVIIAGDCNTGPDSSPDNYHELINDSLTDAFVAAGGSGITWETRNPLVAQNCPHNLAPQRVDHIFLNASAAGFLAPANAKIVMQEHSIELAGGDKIPVSDHYGVLVYFEETGR